MNTKHLYQLLCSLLLLSCQTAPGETDANVKTQHIASGDIITLNKSITIPRLQAHIIIQFGRIIDEQELQTYENSCIVENPDLGPKTLPAQSYRVKKLTYNEEMYSDSGAVMRYFTEIYLHAGSMQQTLILTCQTLDDTMQYHGFSVDEIRQTTGDYFTF